MTQYITNINDIDKDDIDKDNAQRLMSTRPDDERSRLHFSVNGNV